jgi:hypothetical protein
LGNPVGRTPGGTLVRNVAVDVAGGVTFHELMSSQFPAPASRTWIRSESRT